MQNDLLITQYVTLALGALFLALSVAGLVLRVVFMRGAKPCPAVVSNVADVASKSGGGAVTVRFQGPDGVEHEARLIGARRLGVSRPARPEGAPVSVLFNPDRPGRVIENSWWDAWGASITGIVVGLALVAFHVVRAGLF